MMTERSERMENEKKAKRVVDTPFGQLIFYGGIEQDVDPELVHAMIEQAREAREKAHAPYTQCKVGASLVMTDDPQQNILTGANVETAIAGVGSCAERTALFNAIAEGFRKIRYVAVFPEDINGPLSNRTPCGVCRQTISEFSDADKLLFFLANGDPDILADVMTMEELMPCRYVIPK